MSKQGDVALLNDPVARELLASTIPARLAYSWRDGTPRVIPIWFHWNGESIVVATFGALPKAKVLANGTPVALTIDGSQFPYKVLMIRGRVSIQPLNGMVPEYELMAQRYLGDAGGGWIEQVRAMLPFTEGMARVSVTPTWVGILDFEQRFPSAIEHASAALAAIPA
jgi:pyridoxamine 5'-phosphate oxidase-like protein